MRFLKRSALRVGLALAALAAGVAAEAVTLPDGYVRVEYLEGDGHAWVNTGFVTTTNRQEYVLDACLVNNGNYGGTNCRIEWTAGVFGGARHVFHYLVETNGSARYTWIDSGSRSGKGAYTGWLGAYIAVFALGNMNKTSPQTPPQSGKVYEFWLYESDVLVQHLVPVTDPDGVARFYDVVAGKPLDVISYGGTGAFTPGPAVIVSDPVSALYDGTAQEPPVTVTTIDGEPLAEGTDYEASRRTDGRMRARRTDADSTSSADA